eukprot:365676-Chlamydomonas_euryale.AAC.14
MRGGILVQLRGQGLPARSVGGYDQARLRSTKLPCAPRHPGRGLGGVEAASALRPPATRFTSVGAALQAWSEGSPPLAEWIRRGQPAHTPPQRPPGEGSRAVPARCRMGSRAVPARCRMGEQAA